MKKNLVLAICLSLVLSCSLLQSKPNWPECNEGLPKDSLLVEVADNNGVCLQDVGNLLIFANGMNISVLKAYTAKEAYDSLTEIEKILAFPNLTQKELRRVVNNLLMDFPELYTVTDIFQEAFSKDIPLDVSTKDIIMKYIVEDVKPLLKMRIDAE